MQRARWHERPLKFALAVAILAMTTVSAAHVDSIAAHDGVASDCTTCHFVRSSATTVEAAPAALDNLARVALVDNCVPAKVAIADAPRIVGSRAPPSL